MKFEENLVLEDALRRRLIHEFVPREDEADPVLRGAVFPRREPLVEGVDEHEARRRKVPREPIHGHTIGGLEDHLAFRPVLLEVLPSWPLQTPHGDGDEVEPGESELQSDKPN